MFINSAHAQDAPTQTEIQMTPPAGAVDPAMPDTQTAVISNIAFVVLIVVTFYFLLIRPQQKRFKEHAAMLDDLKKGDRVITGGGLIGKVDKITDDEIVVDLGNSVKVTALRSTIQSKKENNKK